jgi:hypothetical protein
MGQCQNRSAVFSAARGFAFGLVPLCCLLAAITMAPAQPQPGSLPPADAQALLNRALANELRAAQDASHPMRYLLHKVGPRLTSTKEIVETRDGEVARLTSIFDKPLSPTAEQQEESRLDALSHNPGQQHHRKQSEDADTARALKVLRVLPSAFVYQYAGPADSTTSSIERFTFKPNPKFSPSDLETELLTEMSGELWIDRAKERVTQLDGRLEDDVDFGWGILGRLNKGGTIRIDQAEVASDQWRTVHFKMRMSGRVFIKTRVFDTTEDQSQFSPVPLGMSYQQAIDLLRGESPPKTAGR